MEELIWLQRQTESRLESIKNSQSVHVGDGQVLTRLFTGQKVFLDAEDVVVAPTLMLNGVWDSTASTVMQRHLSPGSTMIDTDAGTGYFGLVAGTVVQGEVGGSVHLLEPDPDRATMIFRSISATGLMGTASVSNLAVGAVATGAGTDIDLAADRPSSPTTTIDAYVQSKNLATVDLVKLNAGPGLVAAYAGMAETIQRNGHNLVLMVSLAESADSANAGTAVPEEMFDDFAQVELIDGVREQVVAVADPGDLAAMQAELGAVTMMAGNWSH